MGKLSQDHLNRMNPAARGARLGDVLTDLIACANALQATQATLVSEWNAFLAHVDAANAAGIGNTNKATFGVPAPSAVAVTTLTQRGNGAANGGS